MNNADSSEEIRRVALALDDALESRNLQAVTDKFANDCEIELLGVKLFGKEGVGKWVNWMAKFHDGGEARSNQTVVLEFENLKIKRLRMYFDRLDFSGAVAKDVVSKTIVKELIKKSLEGLT